MIQWKNNCNKKKRLQQIIKMKMENPNRVLLSMLLTIGAI